MSGSAFEPALELIDVDVTYRVRGVERQVLRGVSLTVERGASYGLVGESGCGKSTLGRTIKGIYRPTAGDVIFDGKNIARLGKAEARAFARQVQMIFQDPYSSLNPRMVVREIIGEGLEIHAPQLDAAERRERIVQALYDVGLTEAGEAEPLLQRYPHEFSGGQRQRIAIARALIVKPKVVVLDEPTSALDVTIQKQVLELLAGLQRKYGLSYILVTHDIDVVRAMAHRVMVMKASRMVESGPLDEVLGHANPD